MRILYKHRTRGQAVEAVHIAGMANGFRALGHDVDFSSPPLVHMGSSQNVIKNKLLTNISLKSPTIIYEFMALAYNLLSYINSNKLLKKNNYGFIYERYAFFDFSTMLLKKIHKVPAVLEVNGAVNDQRNLVHGRKIIMKRVTGYFEKKLFEQVDSIIVVSSALKDSLIDFGIKAKKILVLPNCIDPKLFNTKVTGREIKTKYNLKGKKVVGFIGSFHPWHGVYFLIKSLESLLKTRKDVRILLIGEGHEQKNVKKLVSNLNLENFVTFTGFVSHTQIPEYIQAMDICTIPNTNNFGSPMKIFEYMAMSKPVISAEYIPPAEIIQDGVNGFLFKPWDGEQLSQLIIKLLGDDNLREIVGKRARKYVYENHTWMKNAEKVLKKYNF